MNNSDFKQTAEKYKSEMMKLYSANPVPKADTPISSDPTPPVPPQSEPIQEESVQNELAQNNLAQNDLMQDDLMQDEIENMEEAEAQTAENANADMPIEERFPPPVLPDFIREAPEPAPNNSFGYLKVNVRTGNGGRPIKDSIVTVSEVINGKENILRLLSTDESGSTETVRLPAPSNSMGNSPQDYNSFAKYNISAYSKGFFRETSVDAPIFAGVTSVQTFFLIPEPFDYNSGERTIVDRNPEPEI